MIGASNHSNLGFRYSIPVLAYAGKLGTSPTEVKAAVGGIQLLTDIDHFDNGQTIIPYTQSTTSADTARMGRYRILNSNLGLLADQSLVNTGGYDKSASVTTSFDGTRAYLTGKGGSNYIIRFVSNSGSNLGQRNIYQSSNGSMAAGVSDVVGAGGNIALTIGIQAAGDGTVITKMSEGGMHTPLDNQLATGETRIRYIPGAAEYPNGDVYILTHMDFPDTSNIFLRKVTNATEVGSVLVGNSTHDVSNASVHHRWVCVRNDGNICVMVKRQDYDSSTGWMSQISYHVYDTSLNLQFETIVYPMSASTPDMDHAQLISTPDNGVLIVAQVAGSKAIAIPIDSQNTIGAVDEFLTPSSGGIYKVVAKHNKFDNTVNVAYQTAPSGANSIYIQKLFYQ